MMSRNPRRQLTEQHQQELRSGLAEDARSKPEVVRIGLLGGFRLWVGPQLIEKDRWRLRKAASLVKLLALAPGHRLYREQLMDLLWPHLDRKDASNNLRRALHVARRALESDPSAPRYLISHGEHLALCPDGPLWVDVEAFEEAAETARRSRDHAAYQAALALYAGDLLPEDRYEDWAEDRRRQLRQNYLDLLVEMAALCEERGDLASAIDALREAVSEEPQHEQAHADLMRLYAKSDQRHKALRQYERLRQALRRGFGTEPGRATQRLHEEIVAGRVPVAELASPEDIPSESTSHSPKHNVPVALSSFVGRERELVEVKRTLAMTRVLTLTGAGGCGKTRLALEVGRNLASSYPDGIWLVELAPLSHPQLVPQVVAGTLGVREQPDRSLVDTLVDHLREKYLLLMLDNCEHLIEACAQLASSLLHSCPRLRVLATGRQALGIAGEMRWRVPSLSLPDPRAAVVELSSYESVRLFLERARLRDPAFALTPQNAEAVIDICGRLEGIPLAIELAAARVEVLSAEQIAEKLGDSLMLLTAEDRTAPARHQTLRGTLDWSFELFAEPERTLFRRLSVFAGGWKLEAAESVGTGGSIEKEDVLNLLTRLVEKSLVVAEATGNGQMRYRMLEPVRQYGQQKLEESGEADTVKHRHAALFLALAEEAEPELTGPRQQEWLERLEAEHGNLRAALSWALEGGEPELALRLSGALGDFWYLRGRLTEEGRGWLEAALKQGSELTTVVRLKPLVRAGSIAMEQRDFERAVAHSEEGLALSREFGDKVGAAAALSTLGYVSLLRNENERALALFEEAIGLAQDVGNAGALSLSVHGLALTLMQKGELERAAALQRENLARARRTGDQHILSMSIGLGGLIALGEGSYGRAEALGLETLKMFWRMDLRHYIPTLLQLFAAAAAELGDPVRSAQLCGASQALHESMGARLSAGERAYFEPHLAAARARLDNTTWETAWAEGQAMTLEQAVEYALGARAPDEIVPPEERSADEPPDASFTRREREVAELVGRDLTNRQIAKEFVISERTVEKHVANILKKLGLHSREQVAASMPGRRAHPS
jgi:predicted ATPase/DNA-binding SARP family transcriptional activator/DNA-binding CsgD family transcriptional regulator